MTGIRERRFWPDPVAPSAIAARAGAQALERSGIDPARIGCLIHASVCRDFLEPATANVVHEALGLAPSCVLFDLSNACLGAMNAVTVAANMIELHQIEAALVVAGENGKPLVESTIAALLADPAISRTSIKDSIASLTIGAGAAALVLARADLAPGHRLLGAAVRSATEHHRLCRGGIEGGDTGVGDATALTMSTDSEALLHAGVSLAGRTWPGFVEATGIAAPDRVITHQVGKGHHAALFAALALDPARGYVTYDRLGNVGSVSLPISLGLAAEAGFVSAGQTVALLGIGSGLSCLMMGVKW